MKTMFNHITKFNRPINEGKIGSGTLSKVTSARRGSGSGDSPAKTKELSKDDYQGF